MGPAPGELRTDPEYRREHLARNVDALADRRRTARSRA